MATHGSGDGLGRFGGRLAAAALAALLATAGLAPAAARAVPLDTFGVAATAGAVYGDAVTLTASATPTDATGDVVFTWDGAAAAPVALVGAVATHVVTAPGAGTHTYAAAYGGDATYDPLTDGPHDVSVAPAPLTVTADDTSRPYGASNPSLTGTITGFVLGESAVSAGVTGSPLCTTTATPASPVGTYPITCTAGTLAAANYTFASFVGGTLTVGPAGAASISLTGGSFTYGGTAHPATGFAYGNGGIGDVLSPAVTFSYQGTGATAYGPTATAPTGAGTYDATASFAGNGTYDPASATVPLAIARAPLTVTASSTSRLYGAQNPTFTATFDGFVPGETLETSGVTGSAACTTTATPASAPGDYPITCTAGTLAAANYTFSFVPGTLTVDAAGPASVSVTGGTFTYSGTPHPATGFAYGNGGIGDVLSPPVTFSYVGVGATTYGPTPTAPTAAGTYAVTASFAGNVGYGSAVSAPAALTIEKALLTVIVATASRPYGALNPAFTATFSGFVNGETAASAGVTGSPSCSTTAGVDSPVGAYPVACTAGTLAAANYRFGAPTGGTLLLVVPVALTVTANDVSRPFGVVNPPLVATFAGFVNGQSLATSGLSGSPACTTTATLVSPVGTYPITCTVGTLVASNYTFRFVGGTLTVVHGASSVSLSTETTVFETRTPVVFTATVEPGVVGAPPSGSVVFAIDGVERPALALDAAGRASVSVTWTTSGPKKVDVAYAGDGSFAAPGTASAAPTVVANTARASGVGLTSTSVYPLVDGWRDTVTARGTRQERLAVAITVTNAKGTVVRRASLGTAAGAYAWAWDGRTSKGAILPAGRYTIRQTLTDPYGTRPRRTVVSSVVLSLKRMQWTTATIASGPGPRCYQFSSGDGVGAHACSSTAPLRLDGDTGHWPAVGYQFVLPSATAYRSIRVQVLGTATGGRPAIGLHDWKQGAAWGQLYLPDWPAKAISPTATSWAGISTSDVGRFVASRRVRVYVDGGGRLDGSFRFDVARVRLVVVYGILK